MTHYSIGTWNMKNGGWNTTTRQHNFTGLVDTIAQYPAPDILMLTEATMFTAFHNGPLEEAVTLLSALLPGTARYLPFMSQTMTRRNQPCLMVNSAVVTPIRFYKPPLLQTNEESVRQGFWNFLEADLKGRPVWLQALHWDGSQGPCFFDMQSSLTGQMANKPCIIAGDFNATSSAPGEVLHDDWGARCIAAGTPWKRRQKGHKVGGTYHVYTDPIDELHTDGFWDCGEAAGDFTVTVNDWVDNGSGLRIDRIIASNPLGADLVDGSYHVFVPEPTQEYSDHRYVVATLDIPTGRSRATLLR